MRLFKYVLFTIILLLIGIRIALPSILLNYVEKQVNKIPEYRIKIKSISVSLWRGSYRLNDIELNKIKSNIPVPFFSAKTVEFAVQWRPLLHGHFVAQIFADEPALNFVVDPSGADQQLTISSQWETAVKSLFPLNFNRVSLTNGKVYLRSYSGKPPFSLALHDVNAEIKNMRNTDNTHLTLPSQFTLTAESKSHGNIALRGNYNPFKSTPTFLLSAELKQLNIIEANNFLQHYTNVKASRGTFSLFIEAAAKNNKITGYAKPIMKNLQIINPDKNAGPIQALYTGAMQFVSNILTNSDKKTIATKVNIQGDIENPKTSILSIIGNMLHHAFIQALLPKLDHNITMSEVVLRYPKSDKTG